MTIEGWPLSQTLAEAALGLWGPQCPVVLCSLAGAGGSPGWDRWLRAGDPQYLVFHDRGHVRQPPHHFGTIWKGKNETPRVMNVYLEWWFIFQQCFFSYWPCLGGTSLNLYYVISLQTEDIMFPSLT